MTPDDTKTPAKTRVRKQPVTIEPQIQAGKVTIPENAPVPMLQPAGFEPGNKVGMGAIISVIALAFFITVVGALVYHVATAPDGSAGGDLRNRITKQFKPAPPVAHKPATTPTPTAPKPEPAVPPKPKPKPQPKEDAEVSLFHQEHAIGLPTKPGQFLAVEATVESIVPAEAHRVYLEISSEGANQRIVVETDTAELVELVKTGGIKPGDTARITISKLPPATEAAHRKERTQTAMALNLPVQRFFEMEEYEMSSSPDPTEETKPAEEPKPEPTPPPKTTPIKPDNVITPRGVPIPETP